MSNYITKGLDIVKAGEYTVGQWMEVWFENYATIKIRPSSHQAYRDYLDHHIKPNIGKIPLSKLATLALPNGVDIKTVSWMLGHYSAGFTLDTYTHITTPTQRKAANTIETMLLQAM